MKYRNDKNGNPISILGYGCMRFTRKGASLDYSKAEAEILRAYEQGVNYYDTAYIYAGSEDLVGRIFENNGIRDKVYIATKLPQYLMRSMKAIDRTFAEELKRLRTDYIDYYLMHMFTDVAEWEKLKALGIEDWIKERKAEGSIRNIGFSYHGDSDMFIRLLDVYDWDFVQIQYNYLDEHTQAGRKGLEEAARRGIPVIIMEPLRGGKLVNLPKDAMRLLKDDSHRFTPAELGLRWLWDQPGVTCVLSGMNSLEMVDENCRIAASAEAGDLTEEDRELISSIRNIIKAREKVGCTGCRYCMPCPKGVDIPGNFHYYNTMSVDGRFEGWRGFFQNMCLRAEPGFASQCVACGKCEQHCPQHLNIIEELRNADRALRPIYFRPVMFAARKYVTHKGKKKE